MGKEDVKLKTYLEDARRYADLWNGSVFHGQQMLKPEELQIFNPVLTKAFDGKVLERTCDLVMMQGGSGQCFAVYTVENQENIDYSMPVRIMIQEALEYDGQLRKIMRKNARNDKAYRAGRGEKVYQNDGEWMYMMRKTDKLYPVITLLIYWGEEEWDGPKSLREMMDFGKNESPLGKELREMIPEYPLHFLNLTDFKHFEYFKTELRPLLELYQKRNCKEEFIEYLRNDEKCIGMDDESWHLLSNLTHSKGMKKLVQEKRQKKEGSRIMCRAMDEFEADCIAKGREEGRNEGKNEGRIEANIENILELLKDCGEVSDKLIDYVSSQKDLSLLGRWLKLAARAESVKEFEEQIIN
ncbi:MAG: Rpn family recombination-promoting nuclease/putative transposase [Lachnospiraceae bacterium]|nr:Rpn family recombination-promoting nuclease/putative transposase [Lachnospiraceae bacterium]